MWRGVVRLVGDVVRDATHAIRRLRARYGLVQCLGIPIFRLSPLPTVVTRRAKRRRDPKARSVAY